MGVYFSRRSAPARTDVELDENVILPDNFHGIVIINAGNISRGMARHVPTAGVFLRGAMSRHLKTPRETVTVPAARPAQPAATGARRI
jgi:hypothetical protein